MISGTCTAIYVEHLELYFEVRQLEEGRGRWCQIHLGEPREELATRAWHLAGVAGRFLGPGQLSQYSDARFTQETCGESDLQPT